MTRAQAGALLFLCDEFGEAYDGTLTGGEASIVIRSFLDEPMTEPQAMTLRCLSERTGVPVVERMSYGRARERIRSLAADMLLDA